MKIQNIEEGIPNNEDRIMILKKADTRIRLQKKADTRIRQLNQTDTRIRLLKKADTTIRMVKKLDARMRMLQNAYEGNAISKKSMEGMIGEIKQLKKPNHMFWLL